MFRTTGSDNKTQEPLKEQVSTNNDPTAGMTPEQKEEFERNYHLTSLVAIDFMERHLLDLEGPIVQCPQNADAISKYVVAHQKPWDRDSLEEALRNLSALGRIKRGTPISDELYAKKEVEDQIRQKENEHAKATEWPWGSTLEGDEGRRRVKRMDHEEYKRHMNDKKFGKEFVRQVEALKILDTQLAGRL